jgi:hypothetical protein
LTAAPEPPSTIDIRHASEAAIFANARRSLLAE